MSGLRQKSRRANHLQRTDDVVGDIDAVSTQRTPIFIISNLYCELDRPDTSDNADAQSAPSSELLTGTLVRALTQTEETRTSMSHWASARFPAETPANSY